MKVTSLHWGLFALVMVVSTMVGIILADKVLERQAEKVAANG